MNHMFASRSALLLLLWPSFALGQPPDDAYIVTAMHDWKVPGLALAVVKDDHVVAASGYGTADGFIFAGQIGAFIDPDKFNAEIWRPITERAGMKGTRYHDLRHFFASQLIAQGESPPTFVTRWATVASKSLSIPMDTYSPAPGAKQPPVSMTQ
jgi:hypothetical protein